MVFLSRDGRCPLPLFSRADSRGPCKDATVGVWGGGSLTWTGVALYDLCGGPWAGYLGSVLWALGALWALFSPSLSSDILGQFGFGGEWLWCGLGDLLGSLGAGATGSLPRDGASAGVFVPGYQRSTPRGATDPPMTRPLPVPGHGVLRGRGPANAAEQVWGADPGRNGALLSGRDCHGHRLSAPAGLCTQVGAAGAEGRGLRGGG